MSPAKLSTTLAWILLISCCGPFVTVVLGAIQCLTCDSTNSNCISDVSAVATADCDGSCFTKSDGGKISRGCLADTNACTAPGCIKCTENGCNKHNICKSCDSSKDPDCSKTDATKESFNSICEKDINTCVSKIKDDKQLERRCATKEEACTNGDICSICTGANCNVGIFPKNRRYCYQCSSTKTECANVSANTDTIKSLPCQLYSPTENCYTYGLSETSMARGCVSDTDTNLNKCSTPESSEACGACGEDNCNNREYKRDQLLKCLQCNSTVDKNCQLDQKVDDAKNCQNKLLFNQNDACFIETIEKTTITRGCLYDRTEQQTKCEAPNCTTCNSGNGCNSKADDEFTCKRCRSDLEPKCKNNADQLTGDKCRNQELTATNMDCFTGVWNDNVIRGCVVDATESQKLECADKNNNQCVTCTGKDCNIKKNGAADLKIASSLFAVILIGLWRLV